MIVGEAPNPVLKGKVLPYAGSLSLVPDPGEAAARVPDHGVVRCGFRLYEILMWVPAQRAFKVREFKATLNRRELQELATRRRPDAKGQAA